MAEVRLLPRSTVFGYHDHNFLTIAERLTDHLPPARAQRPARARVARAREARWCSRPARMERPLVFANNDRPGVMLASAVSAYVNRYGVQPGTRAVVFTNNDSAYRTALRPRDRRHRRRGGRRRAPGAARRACPSACARRGIEVIDHAVVVDVRGTWRVAAST